MQAADTSGELGGRDLQGEERRLPSLGSDPFVLMRGGCMVELGDPGESGPVEEFKTALGIECGSELFT